MSEPEPRDRPISLWSALRRSDSGWPPRLAASIITGLACSSLGLLGAWGVSFSVLNRHYPPDRYIGIGQLIAGLTWICCLGLIWRNRVGRRATTKAVLLTAVLIVVASSIGLAIDRSISKQGQIIYLGIILFSIAIGISIWWPVAMTRWGGRPIRSGEGHIDVACPSCGYALNGLRELRCPECGTTFAIDELIEAQRYAGTRRKTDPQLRKVG